MSARVSELMLPTAQRLAALTEHALKIVAAMIDSDAIARLTITALPAVAPKVAGAGPFFFHLATPQDAVATCRRLPRTISIGNAARATIGFAGARPHVTASVSPAAIQILTAGHAHTTSWLARSQAAGKMQGTILLPRAAAGGTLHLTAIAGMPGIRRRDDDSAVVGWRPRVDSARVPYVAAHRRRFDRTATCQRKTDEEGGGQAGDKHSPIAGTRVCALTPSLIRGESA